MRTFRTNTYYFVALKSINIYNIIPDQFCQITSVTLRNDTNHMVFDTTLSKDEVVIDRIPMSQVHQIKFALPSKC